MRANPSGVKGDGGWRGGARSAQDDGKGAGGLAGRLTEKSKQAANCRSASSRADNRARLPLVFF